MAQGLPGHYVQQYATNVALLLQSRGGRFKDLVMTGSHVGKAASPVEQFGAVEMQRVIGKFQPMGRVDVDTDRRWVYPEDYDLPQLLDTFEKLRLIQDPQGIYVENAGNAALRKQDDLILKAALGTAKTGENGENSIVLPASQVVAVNHGGGAPTGMTVAKLREARRILMANEVDLELDPITIGLSSDEHDNLLGEAQVTSADFNGGKPTLVEGKITRFMGFNFRFSERLEVDGNGYRRIPAWAKSGMYVGWWQDVLTDISRRYDIQGIPWQVYLFMTLGATRLEEKKVVEIKCA